MRIQQWTTRVAGIDRGIRLNGTLNQPAVPGANRSLQSADDTGRQRAIQTKRISNREHLLAHREFVGIAEANHRQWTTRLLNQFDYCQVRVGIATDNFCCISFLSA
jgi:hypothetical protein